MGFESVEIQPLRSPLKKFSIESLKIHGEYGRSMVALPETTVPKLIEFQISSVMRNKKIDPFLSDHPQMKNLESSYLPRSLCHFIGLNMLNLQKLTVNDTFHANGLDQMEHLKELKLRLEDYKADL